MTVVVQGWTSAARFYTLALCILCLALVSLQLSFLEPH